MSKPRRAKNGAADKATRSVTARGLTSAVLWSAAGPLACFALCAGVALWVWSAPLADQRQFDGVLRPVATPIPITLPQYAILQQINVSQGDTVVEGQIVAQLNSAAMEGRRAEIMRQLGILRLERHCLTGEGVRAVETGAAQFLAEDARRRSLEVVSRRAPRSAAELSKDQTERAEFAARIEATLHRCAKRAEAGAAEQEALARHLATAEEAVHLLNRKISLFVKQNDAALEPGRQSELAFEALETLQERNAAARERDFAQQALERFKRESSARNSTEILEKDAAIDARLIEDHTLASLVDDPFLRAPTGGLVSRLRDPGVGQRAVAPLPFITIERAGEQTFTLAITVPARDLERLSEGARVSVTVSGVSNGPALGGAVQKAPPATVQTNDGAVYVKLDQGSRAWLQSQDGHLALNGGATASRVRVVLAQASLGSRLESIASELFNPLTDRTALRTGAVLKGVSEVISRWGLGGT